jgi:hypothetical protein
VSDANRVDVRFGDGSEGHAVAFERTIMHAVGDNAYAPGRPLELTLRLEGEAVEVRGKAIGSKKRDDGRFDLRIRLIDLRRDDRARLEAALGESREAR